MSNNKAQIEELFSLAKEANNFSRSEYELLGSVVVVQASRLPRRRIQSTQVTGSDKVSFQDKLQFSYGL
jgi:hypothetical protein